MGNYNLAKVPRYYCLKTTLDIRCDTVLQKYISYI